jgi:hypothetical protein
MPGRFAYVTYPAIGDTPFVQPAGNAGLLVEPRCFQCWSPAVAKAADALTPDRMAFRFARVAHVLRLYVFGSTR